MSIRRIGILVGREFKYASKGYFFIFAIIAPVAFTLLIQLIFGSLFSDKPKLGILDLGNSKMVAAFQEMQSINLQEYASEAELKAAVETGARDVGIILQKNFNTTIQMGILTKVTTYIWGESLLKHRAIVGAAFLHHVREISGIEAPVEVTAVPLGDKDSVPWEERFLPLIVIMAIFISGFVIPASSLVEEKQKRTLGAVLTTPTTQIDVFVSKGLVGTIMSIVLGITILVLNHALNTQLGLIIPILILGAIMASCFGLLMGSCLSEIASLYSAIKAFGIVLYGPGMVKLFPQIPQWIGKVMPTYYVMNPIMEISRGGGNWDSVKFDVFILLGIIAALIVLVGIVAHRTQQRED